MTKKTSRFRPSAFGFWIFAAASVLLSTAATNSPAPADKLSSESAPPSSPREFFNTGTRLLFEGKELAGSPRTSNRAQDKFHKAEELLEEVLASQVERLQPTALYNLGHVRFNQGIEEFKKVLMGVTGQRDQRATQLGDEAIRHLDEAQASGDIDRMVSSYLEGRGARRELRDAAAAVKNALEICRATLIKWQRASDDFKSAYELAPTDNDARKNAQIVDRHMAEVIDHVRQLEQEAAAMGNKRRELGQKMKALRGSMPDSQAPPGGAGEDEDDDNQPFGQNPRQREGPSQQGREIPLTPEQAAWLLDMFQRGGLRPIELKPSLEQGQPKERSRKTW